MKMPCSSASSEFSDKSSGMRIFLMSNVFINELFM
jgi:hypothetical protein